MSQENVELARRGLDALNRGGVEAMIDLCDPEIDWIAIPGFLPDAEDFHGHAGVRSWFEKVGEALGDFQWEAEEIADGGDRLFVALKLRASGRTSGIEGDDGRGGQVAPMPVRPTRRDTARAMSQENIEVVRRLYEEWSTRLDVPAELFAPDYVLDMSDIAFDVGVRQGLAAAREALLQYAEAFEDFRMELRDVIHADEEHVVTEIRDGGRVKGSDAELWNRYFNAWTFRDGKVVRLSSHTDRTRALKPAGLTE